jgi:hypothetical protein
MRGLLKVAWLSPSDYVAERCRTASINWPNAVTSKSTSTVGAAAQIDIIQTFRITLQREMKMRKQVRILSPPIKNAHAPAQGMRKSLRRGCARRCAQTILRN